MSSDLSLSAALERVSAATADDLREACVLAHLPSGGSVEELWVRLLEARRVQAPAGPEPEAEEWALVDTAASALEGQASSSSVPAVAPVGACQFTVQDQSSMRVYGRLNVELGEPLYTMLEEVASLANSAVARLDLWINGRQVTRGRFVVDILLPGERDSVTLHVRRGRPRHSYTVWCNPASTDRHLGSGLFFGGKAVWPVVCRQLPQGRYSYAAGCRLRAVVPDEDPLAAYLTEVETYDLPTAPFLTWLEQ